MRSASASAPRATATPMASWNGRPSSAPSRRREPISENRVLSVGPAKAGTHAAEGSRAERWIPAFAGMTEKGMAGCTRSPPRPCVSIASFAVTGFYSAPGFWEDDMSGATIAFTGCEITAGLSAAAGASGGGGGGQPHAHGRREVVVAGKRVKTVDVHAHCVVPDAAKVINHPLEAPGLLWSNVGDRLAEMDRSGVDVEALSINPYWYRAERDAAAELIRINNEALAQFCAGNPDRFVAFATASIQFPDLAAQQIEHAVKNLGLRGVGVAGSCAGEDLANPKFHPFWQKCEELGVLVFMHPLGTRELEPSGRLAGNGLLTNTIGNPLETTIALSHLIFEGTLDRFPGLKIRCER